MKVRFFGSVLFCLLSLLKAELSYTSSTVLGTGSGTDFISTIQFYDGFGNSLQAQTFTSDNSYFLTSGTYYDLAGRLFLTTLPFARPVNGQMRFLAMDQSAFANGAYNSCPYLAMVLGFYGVTGRDAEGFPFSQISFYSDPLARISATGGPGIAYSLDPTHGHPSRVWYFSTMFYNENINIDNDGFIRTSRLPYLDQIPELVISPFQPTHFLTVTCDPDGNYSQTITDVFGNTLKTWNDPKDADNLPVISKVRYDILGKVLEEVPPPSVNPDESTESFRYLYATDGSVISKTTPDAGTVLYKYDSAGRLRVLQDEVMRSREAVGFRNTYLVYTYDQIGRLCETGTNIFDASFSELDKSDLDNQIQNTIKIKTLYDTKRGLETYSLPVAITNSMKNLRGNVVASVSYDETGLATPEHYTAAFYSYNNENQIETIYRKIAGEPLFQKTDYTYTTTGNVKTISVFKDYQVSGQFNQLLYMYDSQDRPEKIYVNGRLKVTLQYDTLGRIALKQFFSKDSVPVVIEQVSYLYTIQGSLKNIGTDQSGFSEALFYDDLADAGFNPGVATPSYNGNISAIKFHQLPTITDYAFAYNYDGLNRLTSITEVNGHPEYNEAFAFQKDGRFREKYEGQNTVNHSQLYTYNQGKNQLNSITNHATRGNTNNFIYDKNGNMVADLSKKMVIEYDWRNIPVRFSFFESFPADMAAMAANAVNSQMLIDYIRPRAHRMSFVDMVYDAGGNRVKKTVFND